MKKMIASSEEPARKTFRICYNDGNKKLFEADNIYDALSFVLFERGDNASDIWKIEEVEE